MIPCNFDDIVMQYKVVGKMRRFRCFRISSMFRLAWGTVSEDLFLHIPYTYYLYACSTHLRTRLKHLNISQPSFLMVSYGQGSSLEAALAAQTAWHWLQLRHSWSRFWQQRLHYLPLQRHPSGSASRIMEKVEVIPLDHPTSSNHFIA